MSALSVYSPIGYLVVSMILLGVAATPIFGAADASWHAQTHRASTIDGLRGFLAIAVFFHHATIYHRYLADGVWEIPPSVFYTQLGQSAVILFFMITGYLFWGKAIAAEGKIDWRSLYIGRIFRIGPMYYLVTVAMLALVLRQTGLHLREPVSAVVHEFTRLSLLGYYGPGSLNGYPNSWVILAGVTWTLHYEWLFYLLVLPISAILFARRSVHLPYAAIGFAVAILMLFRHPTLNSSGYAAFFSGMLCSSLRTTGFCIGPQRHVNLIASGITILLLGVLARMPSAYSAIPILLLAAVFFLCSSGCSVFGLLNWRASKRLGEISYGIYLLQGLVLYAFLRPHSLRTFALGSASAYWALVLLAALTLITSALIAHVVIEKPGIRAGRRIALALNPPSPAQPFGAAEHPAKGPATGSGASV